MTRSRCTRSLTVVGIACLAVVTGCTATTSHTRTVSTPTGTASDSSRALGAAGCGPASPIASSSIGPEVQGTGDGATLYGLIMTAAPMPVRVGEQVKIVWRMTGSGPLHLTVTNPQGKRLALQWGPEGHGSSNFDRPGQEWGAGYLFKTAGCWHLHAQRTNASGDVWLQVAPK